MSTQGYIMLSYEWGNQPIVKKIREKLGQLGYRVWIDVEKMKGFIYTTMAKAVKEADLVLVCLSKKYEESENCKSEGSCIREFKRKFIPLKMEDSYKFDDWVAAMFGSHLYVNFSDESAFDEKFKELLRLLEDYPNLKPQDPNPDPLVTLLPPLPPAEASPTSSGATRSPENPELSTEDFNNLLLAMAEWWKRFEKVTMLKVLLCNFPEKIDIDTIEDKKKPIQLFRLLEGAGLIGPSNIDLLAELTVLCGMEGVERGIKEKLGEKFKGFRKITKPTISEYRRSLIKFGQAINKNNKESIGHLHSFTDDQWTDQWVLIFELEHARKLTEENKDAFIELLERNGMASEVKALKIKSK
ncbi:uncharacterized protein LOC117114152 isoform X3 [Anneissia japonica]|uniref:uncharacterized protein LOC117114152 isoform X3 n=1 Tax=Anneissia japonica TaxID=1529436 RepID=UPI0014256BEA|nr:uncharacterized protein LOC117114152 isoform X3 [Anneissia japonica]XP_033113607.1 uncharacterized protein LOC117114152 isoform X3 [Anneissia japonica]XP_033113608.1 uncharacterized protein LOC117114152 isoform X3 [Anneissia japonica]